MKQTLYLIRHGNTPGTESDLIYGATDLPLTEAGVKEIREMAVAGTYPDPEDAAIYTSGMLRTEQTLHAMYGETDHSVAPLLKEVNLGQYEMMTAREVMKDDFGRRWLMGELDPEELVFENGDSDASFRERTGKGIDEIIERELAEQKEKIIVVAHGGVITYIMDRFFPGVYEENMWDWTPLPGSGYEIVLEDGRPVSWSVVGDPDTGYVPPR